MIFILYLFNNSIRASSIMKPKTQHS